MQSTPVFDSEISDLSHKIVDPSSLWKDNLAPALHSYMQYRLRPSAAVQSHLQTDAIDYNHSISHQRTSTTSLQKTPRIQSSRPSFIPQHHRPLVSPLSHLPGPLHIPDRPNPPSSYSQESSYLPFSTLSQPPNLPLEASLPPQSSQHAIPTAGKTRTQLSSDRSGASPTPSQSLSHFCALREQ